MSKMTVQDVITEQFVNVLNEGKLPWSRPWTTAGVKSLVSKKEYRGVNVLILSMLGLGNEFFLTFNQINKLGGKLIKDSKSIPIYFYQWKEEKDQSGQIVKKYGFGKFYKVFPASCVEGIEIPKTAIIDFVPDEKGEELMRLNTCPINYTGRQACYYPSLHKIDMPPKERFHSINEFYSTAFHEIGHSLKAASGDKPSEGDKEKYSFEELVAEIFASFCLNHCNLLSEDCFDNSKAYIQGWASKLKSDPSLVIKAASKAQKRFDKLMGISFNNDSKETE